MVTRASLCIVRRLNLRAGQDGRETRTIETTKKGRIDNGSECDKLAVIRYS